MRAKTELTNGTVRFVKHGKPKFTETVNQVTFSGRYARTHGQEVLYVTEAAVFRLTGQGVRLEEVAPGIDIERDLMPQLGFRPMMADPMGAMAAELFCEDALPQRLFRFYG